MLERVFILTFNFLEGFALMNNLQISEISVFLTKFKNGWLFGIPSWLFGITDRSIASFADGYLSAIDLMQLFTALFFFVSWLYLKPEKLQQWRC